MLVVLKVVYILSPCCCYRSLQVFASYFSLLINCSRMKVTLGYFISFACLCLQLVESADFNPIILVPGDGGSQLEARLNKTTAVHYICQKTSKDFFSLWLNIELLVPVVIDCWIDNMILIYDNVTRTTRNQDGVEIRVAGFGNSSSVEWIDPSQASPGSYFKDIANGLVSIGLKRDLNIRGAPYDFRKGPNESDDYFDKLPRLIEETYTQNGNKPVVIVAHSMGAPMTYSMLLRQKQSWKDKYIRALVSLSGAWAGSVKALKVYVVGDNLGAYLLRESVVRAEQISSPSLAWLMPSKLFWKPDEVLVETPNRNYTINDFEAFFTDIGFPNGWEMYKDVSKYVSAMPPPGVEVHCLHGVGVVTTERLFYKPKQFPQSYPTLIPGDGDGTVNRRSLEACLVWQGKQKQKIYHQTFQGVDHMDILRNKDSIEYITQLMTKLTRQ